MKRVKQNQRIRVVIDGFHFFTTAKQIRQGVGDEYYSNASIQKALDAFEFGRLKTPQSTGIAGRWEDKNVQIDLM